jgi:NADPH-dependent ferric siderophore reductase
MSVAVEAAPAATPYRVFRVIVSATYRLSPTFLRVTFTGPELDRFADNGFDQRVVLALPLPDVGLAHLPSWDDWHPTWRSLPDEHRNPLRTYTVRSVRRHLHEVDVDVVLHPLGLASQWAHDARPGDAAALLGPDATFDGEHGGVDFRPPDPRAAPVLLAGDETAVPAISAILEKLPDDARGEALLEVPHRHDVLSLTAPSGVRISWLPRSNGLGGELVPATRAALDQLLPARAYAWVAGEASMVCDLRRHLVRQREWDRRSFSCRGYWRRSHDG